MMADAKSQPTVDELLAENAVLRGLLADADRKADAGAAHQAALAASEDRLQIAQRAGRIGTFEWDLLSGIVNVSEEFRRIWGSSRHHCRSKR